MTMKENRDTAIFYSKSFTIEIDPLTLKSKELSEPYDAKMTVDASEFETKVGDENRKDIDVVSINNESGTVDSSRKDDQCRLLDNVSGLEKDSNPQVTHEKEISKQISIEHESLVPVEEFTLCNGMECSSSQRDGASDLSKTVTNVFTDKNVLECELPELELMKDICVDNGRPEDDQIFFPSNPEKIKEASSIEVDNGHASSQCDFKEDNDVKFVEQECLTSSSFCSSEKDTAMNCDPLELVQTGGVKFASINNSEEDSLTDEKCPSSQGSLRYLLDSIGEGDKPTRPPNQIPIRKSIPEGSTESSPETGKTDEDVQHKRLLHNIDVETGIIAYNFSGAEKAQSTSSSISLPPQQQPPTMEDINPDCLSANSKTHPVSTKNSTEENACQQHKDANSDDSHLEEQGQSPGEKSHSPTNYDVPAVKPNGEMQECGERVNGDVSGRQLQYEQGETSFSTVAYSGPVEFSGSLSYRSDASTTSTRSFAFPVLQSEWNSSPVRMAKADRRHFRKQKGWRSGILCCRF